MVVFLSGEFEVVRIHDDASIVCHPVNVEKVGVFRLVLTGDDPETEDCVSGVITGISCITKLQF